jgi:hypothetical protein
MMNRWFRDGFGMVSERDELNTQGAGGGIGESTVHTVSLTTDTTTPRFRGMASVAFGAKGEKLPSRITLPSEE